MAGTGRRRLAGSCIIGRVSDDDTPERLEDQVEVAAAPAAVWALVSDGR